MSKNITMSMKNIKVIDAICLLVFTFMIMYIFAMPTRLQEMLRPVFIVINPYRIGSWIMGIGFSVTCIWGKERSVLRWGVLMFICYLITAFLSFFGLLTLVSNWEFLWFLHIVLVICAIIIAIVKRVKK